MTRLFGRVCELQVQNGEQTALRLNGFRTVFNVQKSLRRLPNSVEIKVYNLTDDDRLAIQQQASGSSSVRVKLLAGYEGDAGLAQIFLGNLRDAKSEPDGADTVTTLSGVDGGNASRTSRVSRSFAPGTSITAVLEHMAESLGVGIGNAREVISTIVGSLTGPTVLAGPTVQALEHFCEAHGLEYSVQDSRLQILPRGAALRTSAVVLREDTGSIGEPTITNRGVVSGECLLIPDVVPGRSLDVFGQFVNGTYRCDKAEYIGDTHGGGDWKIKYEARVPRPRTT